MLQTALSRIAGFSAFPIVIVILGAFGLLLLRLFPALGEFLAGLADAITELFEGIRLGCGPLGLLLLPLELLWTLLRKVIEFLWKLIDWLLDVLQSLFDLDGCGCAPLGCLMIPFALVGKLFGLGSDDGGSTGGGGVAGGGSRSRSSVGSTTNSATHAEATQERAQSAAGERARSRGAGVGAAVGAVGAASSRAARAASDTVSGVTGAVRSSGHSAASTSHQRGTQTKQRHTTRMVGKRASIPKQEAQSRVRRAVSGAVTGAKDAVAGAATGVKDNVKAAVGASTDPDYFDDVPQRRAFASAWSITDPEDARDIAEILTEHDIEHSWQIDDETGLPTVTIPNHIAGRATYTLGEYGFDVGEGMPADYISVDRVHEAPEAGTVYDPETDEWVTPEPEWDEGEAAPALEERAVYDPSEGALYDPITDSHFDDQTQGWYDADGEPVAPDSEYVEDIKQSGVGGDGEPVVGEPDVDSEAPGEQPALPPPKDEPDFWWGPQPEPVRARQNEEDDDVIDATYEDVPPQGGEQ